LRKFIVLTALLALFAVPAFAQGHGQGKAGHGKAHHHGVAKAAVAACQAERTSDATAFQTKYANKKGHRAMRRCVKQHVRQAAKACRAERKADPVAFKAKYANKKGHKAGRRCVRQHSGDPVSS
jgi:hypothetical protein